MSKVCVRLLDNFACGPDIDVEEETVWNTEIIRHKDKLYFFEGVNQYGDRVFRLTGPDFVLGPDELVVDL